nr:VPA1267 family protein [Vibrio lentus]
MASGQQKAQQNLEAFEVWKATQTDDDFKQIMFRGQLNRNEVAKGIGCGKSALNQNPALKEALKALEDKLRGKGVLPPLSLKPTTTQQIESCSIQNGCRH